MNCHENKKENQVTHNHSPLKHMLHMIICCGLPIIILAFLPVIARFSPGAANAVGRIVPFLCPIMMVSMMFMMFGGSRKESCCADKGENNDNKQNELRTKS